LKLGSHVGNKGKEMLVGAVKEAINYKANCFMVYLGAPQNSYRKKLEDLNIPSFQELLKEHGINKHDVIVHAPYIVNLAQPNDVKRQFAIDFITNEVKRTYAIGAKYIVVHPGATLNLGIDKGLEKIADSIKVILHNTKETDVEILIETMSGKGSEACYRFEQIKTIIDIVDSPRINVCFDTCHTFDSGYDLVDNYDEVISEFDRIIGIEKIKVIHLNDSKNILGSRKDRHANIGFGNIGFDTLHKICKDKRFDSIPKILETPYVQDYPPYKFEIEMLKEGQFNQNLYNDIEKYYEK